MLTCLWPAGRDVDIRKSGRRQPAEMKKENPSSAKAVGAPPRPTINAPMAGPATPVISALRLVSELALGNASWGVISGISAV